MGFFRWLFRKNERIENSAIEHSSKGDFTINPKSKKISRMKGGGHGQENIDFLESIGFQIDHVTIPLSSIIWQMVAAMIEPQRAACPGSCVGAAGSAINLPELYKVEKTFF